jgi:hypothetical protein
MDAKCGFFAAAGGTPICHGASMGDEDDRHAAVEAHLEALDDEIARLRRMEAAMDRRLAKAEEERRAIEEGPGGGAGEER